MQGCDWPYLLAGLLFDLEEVELQTLLHLTRLLLGRRLLRAQPGDLHTHTHTSYTHTHIQRTHKLHTSYTHTHTTHTQVTHKLHTQVIHTHTQHKLYTHTHTQHKLYTHTNNTTHNNTRYTHTAHTHTPKHRLYTNTHPPHTHGVCYLRGAVDLQLRVQSVVQRRLLQDHPDLVLTVWRQALHTR